MSCTRSFSFNLTCNIYFYMLLYVSISFTNRNNSLGFLIWVEVLSRGSLDTCYHLDSRCGFCQAESSSADLNCLQIVASPWSWGVVCSPCLQFMNRAWFWFSLLLILRCVPYLERQFPDFKSDCRQNKADFYFCNPVGWGCWWFAFCAASKSITCLPQALEPGMPQQDTIKLKWDRQFQVCCSDTNNCGLFCGLCTLRKQHVVLYVLRRRVTQKLKAER